MTEESQPGDIVIRRAVARDVVKILDFLLMMDPGVFFAVDELRAVQSIAEMIERGYLRVAADGDRIVAVLGLSVYVPGPSRDPIMDGEFFCVHPDYASIGIGAKLLFGATRYARDKNVAVRLNLCSRDVSEVTEKLLSKFGYSELSRSFVLEAKKNEGRIEDNGNDKGLRAQPLGRPVHPSSESGRSGPRDEVREPAVSGVHGPENSGPLS